MKKFILSFISFLAISLTVTKSHAVIADWDASIPMDSKVAIALITSKVEDLVFADEGEYCGGQSSGHQLVDYYTTEAIDGALTFFLNVAYNATLTYDFCRTEVTQACQTTLTISEDGQIKVGPVVCPQI